MNFKLITGFKQKSSHFPQLCGYIGAIGVHTCNVSITRYSKPINCMWKISYCCLFSFNLAFTLIINLNTPWPYFLNFHFYPLFSLLFFLFQTPPYSLWEVFFLSPTHSLLLSKKPLFHHQNAPFRHPFSVPPKHVHAVLGHYPSYLCPLLSLMQVKSMSVTFLSLLIAGNFWISSLTLFHRCSPLPFF